MNEPLGRQASGDGALSRTSSAFTRRALALALPLATVGSFVVAASGSALADAPSASYRALASATGLQLNYTSPGFPGTDVPLNSGGPTAEVSVDSLGGSLGYAALPDPGQFVTTVPGLAAGLAAGGAAGLPPTAVPPLPNYPLFVSTDATTKPSDSIGAGPYALESHSAANSGHASARGGFASDLAGNVAFARSDATIDSSDRVITAEAISDVQGLTVGPLTIGQILSKAVRTLNADGVNTPTSSLQISGMRIGGQPVSLTQDQLNLPGPSYPIQFEGALGEALKASGITVTVLSGRQSADTVTAPALAITSPASVPGATDAASVFTMVLGGSMASLSGAMSTQSGQAAAPGEANAVEQSGRGAVATAGGAGSFADLAGGSLPPTRANGATLAPAPPTVTYNTAFTPTLTPPTPIAPFDLDWLILASTAGAILVFGLGQLISQAGVRRLWKSGVG